MSATTLAGSLAEAWAHRAARSLRLAAHAVRAPALFKPDAVERARREYAAQLEQSARWEAATASTQQTPALHPGRT